MSRVVDIARTYIGKKEKPGNSGFEDPAFETEMLNEGWMRGWAWCATFQKLIFKKALPLKSKVFDLFFTPGAVATFNNFAKTKNFLISDKPFVGALVIWRHFENGIAHPWQGHAGVVSEVIDDTAFKAIEGNTSSGGSRNGDRVAEQCRTTAFTENGLNVLGFIRIES
jgi:hypothetical protein